MTLLEKAQLSSMIKRANQRLRELEKQDIRTQAYNYVVSQKYEKGVKYMGTTRKGEVKFRTDITKMNTNQLRALKETVENFLKSKTSTVKGFKQAHRKAFESTNKRRREEGSRGFTWSEYNDMWQSTTYARLKELYGSDEAQDIMLSYYHGDISEEELNEIMKGEMSIIEVREMMNRGKEAEEVVKRKNGGKAETMDDMIKALYR